MQTERAKTQKLERRLRRLKAEIRKSEKARTSAQERSPPSRAGSALLDSDADQSFSDLEHQLGGASGLAVSLPGRGQKPIVLGTLSTGPAWSTMKVPLAMAAVETSSGSTDLMTRAITGSDNAAAESLWSSLGSPQVAGTAVEAQLVAAGDDQTPVQTQRVRAGFTAFGQTDWSLAQQQRFIAGMSCVASSKPVLRLMGQVESDQRWGLGTLSGPVRFKGGWGPDPGGSYLVRQMGIMTLDGRLLPISVMTRPVSGSFDAGTQNLTRIAQWATRHINVSGIAPGSGC